MPQYTSLHVHFYLHLWVMWERFLNVEFLGKEYVHLKFGYNFGDFIKNRDSPLFLASPWLIISYFPRSKDFRTVKEISQKYFSASSFLFIYLFLPCVSLLSCLNKVPPTGFTARTQQFWGFEVHN